MSKGRRSTFSKKRLKRTFEKVFVLLGFRVFEKIGAKKSNAFGRRRHLCVLLHTTDDDDDDDDDDFERLLDEETVSLFATKKRALHLPSSPGWRTTQKTVSERGERRHRL